MAVIYVPGAFSGTQYAVNIAGDVPTPAEQARIDQYVAQQPLHPKTPPHSVAVST